MAAKKEKAQVQAAPVPAEEKEKGMSIGKLADTLHRLAEVYPKAVVVKSTVGPVRRVCLEAEVGTEEEETSVKITLL